MIPYLSRGGVFVRKGTWLEFKLSLPTYLFELQTVTQTSNRAFIDLIMLDLHVLMMFIAIHV